MGLQEENTRSLIIEGNIGAGKSTFLKMINEYLDIQAVFEPHEKWQHIGDGDENLLDKFYKDINRWSYTFQTFAFVSRVVEQENYRKQYPNAVHIVERSVYSDRYCFAKNCFEMGVMTALEWKLYQEWFVWLVENYTPKPSGFIYLKTDPEVCFERLVKRNRSEEVGVTLVYLQSLHTKHEQWLVQKENIASYLDDVPVLVLECNKEFETDRAEQEKHVQKIIEFFNIVPHDISQTLKRSEYTL